METLKKPSPDTQVDNFLPNDFVPGPMHVICARGRKAYNHPGNQRYRKIIELNLAQYSAAASKSEKSFIISTIIESVRDASLCADFIHLKDERWILVQDSMVREKIGQSFRDMLHTKYRSSNKAKKRRHKETMNNLDLKKSPLKFECLPPQIASYTGLPPPAHSEHETTTNLPAGNAAFTEVNDTQPLSLHKQASIYELDISTSVEFQNTLDVEVLDMEPIPVLSGSATSELVNSELSSKEIMEAMSTLMN